MISEFLKIDDPLITTLTRILADYRKQRSQGIETPVFDPDRFKDLDIDPLAWENAAALPCRDEEPERFGSAVAEADTWKMWSMV
nr:hypothetical protein [uncultured Desulfobacter sp.]